MAFCTKIFLHESPGSRRIIRSHISELVIYCLQSLANFPLALSFRHSGYFCLGGGGGRVRCFFIGICEGSCINSFWEVGGPQLFSQKISKIPRPTPPNKKRTFPYHGYHIYPRPVFLRRRRSFTSRKLYVSVETFLCFFHQFYQAYVSQARCIGLFLLCPFWRHMILISAV